MSNTMTTDINAISKLVCHVSCRLYSYNRTSKLEPAVTVFWGENSNLHHLDLQSPAPKKFLK